MANGSRYDSLVGQNIDLKFQFILNNAPYDAYQILRVEIKSANSPTIIQTIDGANVTKTAVGLYEYIIDPVSVSGTYNDTVWVIPKQGYSPLSFLNSFFVRQENFGGGSSAVPSRCQVSGYILDLSGQPVPYATIKPMLVRTGRIREYSIIKNPIPVTTDSNGFFTMSLVRSTEFLPNIMYDFDIRYGSYQEVIRALVPNLDGMNFNDLSFIDTLY